MHAGDRWRKPRSQSNIAELSDPFAWHLSSSSPWPDRPNVRAYVRSLEGAPRSFRHLDRHPPAQARRLGRGSVCCRLRKLKRANAFGKHRPVDIQKLRSQTRAEPQVGKRRKLLRRSWMEIIARRAVAGNGLRHHLVGLPLGRCLPLVIRRITAIKSWNRGIKIQLSPWRKIG